MATVPSLCDEPNVVVGLISSALVRKGPTFASPWDIETIELDDHLVYLKPRRLREAPPHLRKVMDAIVGVSALSSQNADLACGLRMHESKFALELVLCGSTPISSATLQHIHRIWNLMAGISTLRAAGGNIEESYMNFDCTLLKYAMGDLQHIFASETEVGIEWKRDSDFLHLQLKDGPGSTLDEANAFACIPVFADIVECASVCGSLLQNMTPWDSDIAGPSFNTWSELREKVAKLHTLVGHLIGLPGYDSWTYLLMGRDEITAYLKHIGQFSKHLHVLHEYARSRRHRVMFSFSLHVTCMKPLHPKAGSLWPSSKQQWTEIRDHIYAEQRRTFIGGEDVHDLTLLPDQPEELVMHPELSILTYLADKNTLENSHSVPYSYIAISGLACKACSMWIRFYNEFHREVAFAISGSNNEWVPGWCIPDLGRETAEFREFIQASLMVYFGFAIGKKFSGRPEPRDEFEPQEWRDEGNRHLVEKLPY